MDESGSFLAYFDFCLLCRNHEVVYSYQKVTRWPASKKSMNLGMIQGFASRKSFWLCPFSQSYYLPGQKQTALNFEAPQPQLQISDLGQYFRLKVHQCQFLQVCRFQLSVRLLAFKSPNFDKLSEVSDPKLSFHCYNFPLMTKFFSVSPQVLDCL